jgi:biotin-[acetyl-CoA-carboxylase] ligase BirA-like protein
VSSPEVITTWPDQLESVIEGTCIDRVMVFEDTLSTQDSAARACNGLPKDHPPVLVVSSIQRMGRGQRANNWYDGEGCTLPCSLAVGSEYLNLSNPNLATRAGLAALDAICDHAQHLPIMIKWPNDIMVRVENRQRKISGVLIEHAENSIVIGVGINCKQSVSDFHPMIQGSAVSLAQLGVQASRIDLACSLTKSLDYWLTQASEDQVRLHWKTYDGLTGRHAKLVYDNTSYIGEITHIDPLDHITMMWKNQEIKFPVTQTRIIC